MRYEVLESLRVKASKEEFNIENGKIVTLPKEMALRLINKGKIKPLGRVVYKVYSDILQAFLWIVETDQDMHTLRQQEHEGAIYTADEIRMLKGSSREHLKAVHNVKTVFQYSQVIETEKEERCQQETPKEAKCKDAKSMMKNCSS